MKCKHEYKLIRRELLKVGFFFDKVQLTYRCSNCGNLSKVNNYEFGLLK